jgi:hypothetical protein
VVTLQDRRLSTGMSKSFGNGDILKVWKNNCGISLGFKSSGEGKAKPLIALYSKKDGGYTIKLNRDIMNLYNVDLVNVVDVD